MTAIFRHELRTDFHTLTTYLFGACLLAFIGIWAMMYNIQASVSNFEYVLGDSCLAFVVIVPILTMRTLAEERRQKTDQLLYSLPITSFQVVLGKYLALLTVYAVPLCLIAVYPLIFAQYGEVYLPTSYGSLFAFFLLGAALLAVGMFLSSLTENQGFAAGLGIAVILLNYYSVSLSRVCVLHRLRLRRGPLCADSAAGAADQVCDPERKAGLGSGTGPSGSHSGRLFCRPRGLRGAAPPDHDSAVPLRAVLRLCQRRL